MRILASFSPARLASLAMVGTGLAMASQLVSDRWPSAISTLIVMSAAMAWVAAREVRHDDVLGWTMVTGHAVATTAVIVVVMTIGFPGVRELEWDASSIATVAFACTALVAGTTAGLRGAAARRDRRARP